MTWNLESMWYASSHPGNQYLLEEIVAYSVPAPHFWPTGTTPVCASCASDNARHQYVLDEIAVYDQPGMAGFGFLAGRQGRKSRVKRLRPVVAKGRVFGPPAGAQASGQVPGYGSGGGDAMQAVAAAEIGVQAERASRWQRPITASSGAEKLNAIIGGGIGQEAYDARQRAQWIKKHPQGLTPAQMQEVNRVAGVMGKQPQWRGTSVKPGDVRQLRPGETWGVDKDTKQRVIIPAPGAAMVPGGGQNVVLPQRLLTQQELAQIARAKAAADAAAPVQQDQGLLFRGTVPPVESGKVAEEEGWMGR